MSQMLIFGSLDLICSIAVIVDVRPVNRAGAAAENNVLNKWSLAVDIKLVDVNSAWTGEKTSFQIKGSLVLEIKGRSSLQ